jgi:FAD/FMN-containing dehydrogenase
MNKIASYLNRHIVGNVYSSPSVIEAYSTDASVLKIRPKIVALPHNTDDIRKLVRFSNQLATKKYHLPITVRGTGLDKTGASIGKGMIISMERMNKIQEIDPRQRLVRLQTGVTIGQLNSALSLHGLTIPIAANPNATIGGLIANYHRGNKSAKYGDISDYVDQAEIVLSSGDVVQTDSLSKKQLSTKKGISGFEGNLYRELDNLISESQEVISQLIDPKNIDMAGYETVSQVRQKGSFDLLPLFFAAQGTLGIITEVIMSCELSAPEPTYVAVGLPDIEKTISFLNNARKLDLGELNIFDLKLISSAGTVGKTLSIFKRPLEEGFLVIAALDDIKSRKRHKKVAQLEKLIPKHAHFASSTPDNYEDFLEVSSILSSYLNNSNFEHPPIADDVYISPGHLPAFISSLSDLENEHKTSLPIYGSFATNNYSVRPEVDMSSVAGRQFILNFLKDYAKVVESLGGYITGGSPEGRVKAMALENYIDPYLLTIYSELKRIMDPNDILNPGIKVGINLKSTVRYLRTAPNLGITSD